MLAAEYTKKSATVFVQKCTYVGNTKEKEALLIWNVSKFFKLVANVT